MNTICNNFESYIKDAQNIFDIMAAAYKSLYPFEPMIPMEQDSSLCDIISCFSEQDNILLAFANLKENLLKWIHNQNTTGKSELRKKLFFLIRLIDGKCVHIAESFLPDSYIRYFSLNQLLQNEICILPRSKNTAINLLSDAIKKKSGYGFYGRNYSKTADISGYINNFIIYKKINIMPRIIVPNYYREILQEFERKKYKLKVGIFPLSNVNLNRIFLIKEEIDNDNREGLFYIESAVDEQESQLLERCKEALRICRYQCVDIAVFPEMLFTKKNQNAIIDFIKESYTEEDELRFPQFIWLGTSWSGNENKCMVVDQYGKIVFEQKKYVPYEYKKTCSGNTSDTSTADYMKNLNQEKIDNDIIIREALSHEETWVINFLDIPDFLRIATAICRDISDNYLVATLKELYSDMVVIPAFSGSNRLTGRTVNNLAMEKIITLVCNACSALCTDSQEKFEAGKQMIGKKHTFCYLCLPAKHAKDNAADYHTASYTSICEECKKCCNGYIWEIDFNECIVNNNLYSAKVI